MQFFTCQVEFYVVDITIVVETHVTEVLRPCYLLFTKNKGLGSGAVLVGSIERLLGVPWDCAVVHQSLVVFA